MRTVSCAKTMVLAVAVGAVLLAVAPSADARPRTGSLGLPAYSDMVADQANHHVFVSGGKTGNGVVVTDFHGWVRKTIDSQFGASGMTLSADGRTLYVALASGDAISAIDTTTLAETARYPTGAQSCPAHLARTGTVVWFGYGCEESWNGGIGKLDTAATPPTVTLDLQGANVHFHHAPLLASRTGDAGPLVAGQAELSQSAVYVYAVTGGKLDARASGAVVGSDLTDLALSPDGKTIYTASGSRDAVEAFNSTDLTRAGAYHTGQYPNAVATSPDGRYIAGGVRNPRDDVYVYETGGAVPLSTLDATSDGVLAPRGLAWSTDNERLFAITRPANGSAPTLRVLDSPAGR
ncbi:YncE family protein [Amycolatopsis sp. NPDC059027]|uniref:YncE family protein n=1 Tax=Amycolatopsis sp. NPDC059027 TaxID=3346709 RepID=UPI00366CD4A6